MGANLGYKVGCLLLASLCSAFDLSTSARQLLPSQLLLLLVVLCFLSVVLVFCSLSTNTNYINPYFLISTPYVVCFTGNDTTWYYLSHIHNTHYFLLHLAPLKHVHISCIAPPPPPPPPPPKNKCPLCAQPWE